MPDISLVDVGVLGATTSSTLAPPFPSAAQDDVLLAELYSVAGNTPTPPSGQGWTQVATVVASGVSSRATLFRKVFNSGDTTQAFTGGGTSGFYGVVSAWRDVDTTNPLDVAAVTNTGTSGDPVASSVTTVTDRAMVVALFTGDDNNEIGSPTTNSTSLTYGGLTYSSTTGSDACFAAAHKLQTPAAAVGTISADQTTGQTRENWTAITVALRPAAGPVQVDDTLPAAVGVGSPSDESVEALTNTVSLADTQPAGLVVSSPEDEAVAVSVTDPAAPAAVDAAAPAGESVGVAAGDVIPAAVLAASPSGEDVTVAEPGLPAGGAPHIDLWLVDRTTGALVRLPHTLSVDLSPLRNAPGAFRFEYPAHGRNFELLRAEVEDQRRRVEIEMWVGGSRFNAMRGLVLQAQGDDVAEDSVWQFSGHFLEWLMSDARLAHDPADEKGEVRFSAVTAGTLIRTIMQQAQARGTLTDVDFSSFTNTTDSTGAAWAKTVTIKFTPYKTTYLGVLDRLVALGLCEWEIDRDHKLRVYNPGGLGRDLTTNNPPVRLKRATSLLESQRRIDLRDVGTDLYGTGAEGLFASAVDATARARIGAQIERDVDSNQIADQAALTAFVQNSLGTVTEPVIELTHGLLFGTNLPAPVSGFRVHDWLYSDVGRGLERVRVVQWVLAQDVNGVTGSVTLNDTIGDAVSRLRRRLDALADGSATVGTSTPTENSVPPAAPTGVVVDSNIAYQVPEHSQTLAELIIGWNEVTTNADGTAADDVDTYRVQYTYLGMNQVGTILDPGPGYDPGPLHWIEPSGSPTRDLFLRFGDVEASADVAVRVAAIDRWGNQSAWSATVQLTTASDDTGPPTPSAPLLSIWFATLDVSWNGLGAAGEAMPSDTSHVEVWISRGASLTLPATASEPVDFDPAATGPQHVANLFTAGTWNQPGIPHGVGYYAVLRAVDRSRNPSTQSAVAGPATAAKLVQIDIGPNAIGSQQIIDLEVVRAKIANLAVNSAKVEEIQAGLITTGTLVATVTLTGIIQTASTGLRWEGDPAGIRFYNSSNQLTIQLDGASGNTLLTGTLQTALAGERVVLSPDGTFRLYPAAGTNYNAIYNEGGGGLIFRSTMDASNRAGYLYLRSNSAQISYGTPGTLIHNARLQCSLNASELWGGQIVYRADRNFGDVHRHTFTQFQGSADVTNTVLHLQDTGGTGQFPWFHSIGGNSGWIFGPNYMAAVNVDGNLIEVRASNVAFGSSRQMKHRERPIAWTMAGRAEPVTALDVVKAVESLEWEYLHESPGGRPPSPGKVTRRVVDADGHETFELVDGEWSWQERPAPKHYGPMAEDLAAITPDLVRPDQDDPTKLFTDLRDLVGVLWQAVRQLDAKVTPPSTAAGGPR